MTQAASEFLVQKHPAITRLTCELFISDVHFPDHDPEAWELTCQVAEFLQPEIIFHGGDIYDFYQFSRFEQDPRRQTTLHKEISAANQALRGLWKLTPRSQLFYKPGNHEAGRWEKYLWKVMPELMDHPMIAFRKLLELENDPITFVPNTHLYKIGDLYHAHGDEFPAAKSNPARDIFKSLQGNVIFGHWHTISLYYHRVRAKNRQYGAFGNGCLSNLNPEYTRFPQWQQGVSKVLYTTEGLFHVDQIPYFRTKKGKLGCIVDGELFTV